MKNSNPPEPTITVRELKDYLEKHRISPEKLAEQAELSHMTIRRWLKHKNNAAIPKKYYPILKPLLAQKSEFANPFPASFTVGSLMKEIEKSGAEFKDVHKLQKDLKEKLRGARIDRIMIDYTKQLFNAVKNPKISVKAKAICVGALIYFISPIDLIPDHIPVVGYLDDLAVLSLAVNSLRTEERDLELKEQASAKRAT